MSGTYGGAQTNNILHPGYETGLYYGPFFVGATLNYTLTTSTIFYQFTYIPRDINITSLAVNVTTASTGINLRLGIYNASGGNATSLVLDAGTVSAATTGQKDIAVTQFLPNGWYVFASTASGSGVAVTGISSVSNDFPFIGYSSIQTYGAIGKSGGFTYGSLPSTAPSPYSGGSNVPIIWFKT